MLYKMVRTLEKRKKKTDHTGLTLKVLFCFIGCKKESQGTRQYPHMGPEWRFVRLAKQTGLHTSPSYRKEDMV